MRAVILFFLAFSNINGKEMSGEKQEFCNEIAGCTCDGGMVCGIRWEGNRFHLKIFDDECALLQFGCQVEYENDAYGIINMEYCKADTNDGIVDTNTELLNSLPHRCDIYNCSNEIGNNTVCAIRPYNSGFKVRLFISKCHILKYNCEKNITFEPTDHFICNDVNLTKEDVDTRKVADINAVIESKFDAIYQGNLTATLGNENVTVKGKKKKKNLIVVNAAMFDTGGGINDTINNFFAATHVFDLPLRNLDPLLDKETRRRIVTDLGPVKVFTPWVTLPKNFSFMKDPMHWPTLASCFHRCPLECPDTYNPVCGVPGTEAREPRLMFKNHCLMDAAQCKMKWEGKSSTAEAASYKESSFLFCLGDVLNGLYRFLPLVRTLQHMGRIKRKGRFFQHIRNMRFYNDFLSFNPHLMG